MRTPFFFNENNESKKMATVSMAVISGAKFAYPNGIRLKYENVSFTLSVGDGAKVQTAPSGNASNTIVKVLLQYHRPSLQQRQDAGDHKPLDNLDASDNFLMIKKVLILSHRVEDQFCNHHVPVCNFFSNNRKSNRST